jgi:CheY-like chemotaxis protein
MERGQNKFNETGLPRQEYQGKGTFCKQKGYDGLYGKEQTDQFLIRKVEITIEMFYIKSYNLRYRESWMEWCTLRSSRPARRVLIAEPEGDIQMLYRLYLESRGLKVTIVSSGANCLDSVFNTLDNDGFDTIILDTHLKDISGIEVARKIKQRLPDQRIIITSTTGVHVDEIEPVGLSKAYDVLQKPIYFSKLLGLIKPEK